MWSGAPTWIRPSRTGRAASHVLAWPLAARCLAGVLVAWLGVSVAAVAAERSFVWRHDSLPASMRGRVHRQASHVPAFPMDDKRLLKPKGWPESMTIGGVPCALRIHAWDDDDAYMLTSLKELEPDNRVMLFYDAATSDRTLPSAGWGPRYLWNERGKLMQRLWYEPDSARLVTHDYTYYQGGQLLGYSRRAERRRHQRLTGNPYEFLSEFYDKDGRLIAVAYENMTARSRDSVYAWKGAVIPYDQFRMNMHVLYSSAHPGSR